MYFSCDREMMSRESRVRVRVRVMVSVMTAYFFSNRSLACVSQCLVDQIISHVTDYWCHAKLGLGLELGLVYCSLSVAIFADKTMKMRRWCL